MVRLKDQSAARLGGPISGSDFLQLRADDAPAKGLTAWLADGLRAAIATGRLAPGARLPATRLLAGRARASPAAWWSTPTSG